MIVNRKGISTALLVTTLVILSTIGAVAYNNSNLQLSPRENYEDSGGAIVPFFGPVNKIYLTDGIDKVKKTLTDNELPTVLADGQFFGNVVVEYVQTINLGSFNETWIESPNRLIFGKQPTSNNDPIVAFKLSTSSKDPLYNLSIIFSNNLDLTNPRSKDKEIKIFNRKFIVGNETNFSRLVLYGQNQKKMVLQDGVEVKLGSEENTIDGTKVYFKDNLSSLSRIVIQVAAKDSDNDALVEGEKFIDPIFGTFMFDFKNMSIPENSLFREEFSISNSGDNKITLTMIEHRGYRKIINWLLSDGNGHSIISDSNGNIIATREWDLINNSAYATIGNKEKSHFIKITSIFNSSQGYENDKVTIKDFFSNKNYEISATSEGVAILNIDGETYYISYFANNNPQSKSNYIRINYVYPTIQSSMAAQLAFYEPLIVDLNDYDGKGTDVSAFIFPNGEGYSVLNVSLDNKGGFTINGLLVDKNENITLPVGQLKYDFTFYSENVTRIFLDDVSSNQIKNPSIIILENKTSFEEQGYDALIIKIEGLGNDMNGVGVEDVETTWGNDNIFDEIQLESNQYIYKSMDRWGSTINTIRRDSDQYNVKISYNKNQSYAEVYAVEII